MLARLRLAPCLAVCVAVALAATLATGCSPVGDDRSGSRSSSAAAGSPATDAGPADPTEDADDGRFDPDEADFAAIDRLLGDRADAVLRRDRAAFLATVDGRSAAVEESQGVLFDNLAELDLASFGYRTTRDVLTPDPVAGSAPVMRVQTVERVRLAGTFVAPIGNVVRMTYVRRGGRWLVGNETTTPPDRPGDATQPRPWFGVPIEVATRGDLVAMADRSDPGLAERLADLVTAAISSDAALLGVPTEDEVVVDATSNGQPVRMNTLESTEAAAVYSDVFDADGAGRVTRLAGGAVRVNPSMTADELESDPGLLRHELAHFLLRRYSGAVPLWASEGIAEYARWYPLTLADLQVPDRLWQRLQSTRPELPVTGLFSLDARANYLIAQAAVEHLLSQGGPARFLRLLDRYVSDYRLAYGDELTDQLLRDRYGFGAADLARETWTNLAELAHPD